MKLTEIFKNLGVNLEADIDTIENTTTTIEQQTTNNTTINEPEPSTVLTQTIKDEQQDRDRIQQLEKEIQSLKETNQSLLNRTPAQNKPSIEETIYGIYRASKGEFSNGAND